MVNYRRNRLAGGSYFFTVNLKNRQSQWLTDYIDVLRVSFRYVKQRHAFQMDAVVILPDHLHAIWTLPLDDSDYPTRWRLLKSTFTRALKQHGVDLLKNRHGEHGLWQRRYWEHTLKDERDFNRHVDYIHFNPIKHGYVDAVSKWPYSSFHRYVAQEILPLSWGQGEVDFEDDVFGE